MWKKSEESPSPTSAPPVNPTPGRGAESRQQQATIGPSIRLKGDLSGDEDLTIEGRIEGEVRLKDNRVSVGKSGRVKADIYAKSIGVDGEVRGNLYGTEEVVIRASGRVQGNIVSPRVILENGSKFKGSVDMEPVKREPEKPAGEGRATAGQQPPDRASEATPKPKGSETPAGMKSAAPNAR